LTTLAALMTAVRADSLTIIPGQRPVAFEPASAQVAGKTHGDRWRREERDRNYQEQRRNVHAMVGISAPGEETEDLGCKEDGKEHVPEA